MDIDKPTIEALKRGDDRAYKLVLESLSGPVYSFLLRLCRNRSTAENLTQETFLALWRGVGTFKGRSSFKTWVFGIAYHQYLRWQDKRKVETVPINEDCSGGLAPDPSNAVQESEDMRRVRKAVYSLPETYREVVCLVHLEGFSYHETSRVLGKSMFIFWPLNRIRWMSGYEY